MIVTALFESEEFNSIFKYLQPWELRDDAKMEVIGIVCGWGDDKIIRLHNQGALHFYVRKTAHYSVSATGLIRKKYFPLKADVQPLEFRAEERVEIAERYNMESRRDQIINAARGIDSMDSVLVKLYLKYGTYRDVSRVAGIPHITCFKRMRRVFKQLKQTLS
jgi:hypothetical protein